MNSHFFSFGVLIKNSPPSWASPAFGRGSELRLKGCDIFRHSEHIRKAQYKLREESYMNYQSKIILRFAQPLQDLRDDKID